MYTVVNDVHSQLNPTLVDQILEPGSLESVREAIRTARRDGKTISVAGGRHAMGGQQFGAGNVLVDMTARNRVLHFNPTRGLVEVEAGIQWPELMEFLAKTPWGIAQKQTGADRLSVGGAVSANAHGRGLRWPPLVGDVEAFMLLDARAELHRGSRQENRELFSLAIGGYGLFGVITSVTLRLRPRQKVERLVELGCIDDLVPAFERRIKDGFLYGDFQFATNPDSPDFLRRGVFSCYRPVAPQVPLTEEPKELSESDWQSLIYLAHADKTRAFERYTAFYLETSGQVYWADTHQLGVYLDDYHSALDRRLGSHCPATEVITEVYVPRAALAEFLAEVRQDFRSNGVDLIYGTIRLIEPDRETFLAWARQDYACIVFNLHTVHSPAGMAHSAAAFRRLIDMAIRRDGSYYLTYHRHATREQVEACYPQFSEFLRRKREYDPDETFQSEWYRHHRCIFS